MTDSQKILEGIQVKSDDLLTDFLRDKTSRLGNVTDDRPNLQNTY